MKPSLGIWSVQISLHQKIKDGMSINFPNVTIPVELKPMQVIIRRDILLIKA